MTTKKIPSTIVSPEGTLEHLSAMEVDELTKTKFDHPIYTLFRQCALAVLNAGAQTDSVEDLMAEFADFEIHFVRQDRGIRLHLINAPGDAFVDGKMIHGVRKLLFSVLRDVLYVRHQFDLEERADNMGELLSDGVYRVVRNAGVLRTGMQDGLVVCWGGHSIGTEEYKFCKRVGYQLGLRDLGIITGCGPGAMKAPMKGAAIGHAKQQHEPRRYIGLTENSIIAAEPPNAIVNELVIMPDIEKRLEAFVRVGHGLIVFPGGPGTAEEILYALALKLHPKNKALHLPLIFAAGESSRGYFDAMDIFLRKALGEDIAQHYRLIVGDPEAIAREMREAVTQVMDYRCEQNDSFSYNWGLHIPEDLQTPFIATHDSMAQLDLHLSREPYELAVELRRVFSGVVSGNIKEAGIRAVRDHGPFQLSGDQALMDTIDELLQSMVSEGRMKIAGDYIPCYEIRS
ncbi:nucleotide 5'-monophosphate nucleosidase PpnN [uncultured Umboniibacter sp.]|uniref:nucleotide 5'-monophosphate nucleosidase PpnN n=1 Tax=uncultured Umboniibacter sp. TaxID=1798917 RepID=UPI0026146D87|nr:nucleotide 5'-monophosphate nucleosidase PpnN [uncultured Umboniibacter sp.]